MDMLGNIKKLVGDHPRPTLKNGPTHISPPPLPQKGETNGKYRIHKTSTDPLAQTATVSY